MPQPMPMMVSQPMMTVVPPPMHTTTGTLFISNSSADNKDLPLFSPFSIITDRKFHQAATLRSLSSCKILTLFIHYSLFSTPSNGLFPASKHCSLPNQSLPNWSLSWLLLNTFCGFNHEDFNITHV